MTMLYYNDRAGKLLFNIDAGSPCEPMHPFTGFALGPSKNHSIFKVEPLSGDKNKDISWSWNANMDFAEFAQYITDCLFLNKFDNPSQILRTKDGEIEGSADDVLSGKIDSSKITHFVSQSNSINTSWTQAEMLEHAQHHIQVQFQFKALQHHMMRHFLYDTASSEDYKIIRNHWHMLFTTMQGYNVRDFSEDGVFILRVIKALTRDRGIMFGYRWNTPYSNLYNLVSQLISTERASSPQDIFWNRIDGGNWESVKFSDIGEDKSRWQNVHQGKMLILGNRIAWGRDANQNTSSIIVQPSEDMLDMHNQFELFQATASQSDFDTYRNSQIYDDVWEWKENGGLLS